MATNHKASTTIVGNTVYINNKMIPLPPMNSKNTSITVIGDKVFMNGFEYKNGRWERTLRALWHMLF